MIKTFMSLSAWVFLLPAVLCIVTAFIGTFWVVKDQEEEEYIHTKDVGEERKIWTDRLIIPGSLLLVAWIVIMALLHSLNGGLNGIPS